MAPCRSATPTPAPPSRRSAPVTRSVTKSRSTTCPAMESGKSRSVRKSPEPLTLTAPMATAVGAVCCLLSSDRRPGACQDRPRLTRARPLAPGMVRPVAPSRDQTEGRLRRPEGPHRRDPRCPHCCCQRETSRRPSVKSVRPRRSRPPGRTARVRADAGRRARPRASVRADDGSADGRTTPPERRRTAGARRHAVA